MSYETQFKAALQAVGADESKWAYGNTGHPWNFEYLCSKTIIDIEAYVRVDASVFLEYCDDVDQYTQMAVRPSDGNLTESVRFAENLRRLLAGEPPLEVERLQKALDQASESMWIETMGVERNVDANTQDAWRYPLEDVILARAGSGYAIIGRAEDNPELAAELKRRVQEVQE